MAKEYVPYDAYGLLRRIIDHGPQRVRNTQVEKDAGAHYLITRGLAMPTAYGARIENTDAGRQVGLIEWEPPASSAGG